jgi:CDP-diacylglycerol--serine O-phosphatidyltransferase
VKHARYIVPNLFTSLNFLIGVWAILFASGGLNSPVDNKIPVIFACHMVIYCVLLDKLDGFAAKVMKASSEFGAQFDSLADLIAFGIAPAFCLLHAYRSLTPEWYAEYSPLLLVGLSLYVLCAAMRLARYNAVDSDSLADWFMGLPSTLAGGLNVVVLIIAYKYGFFNEDNVLLPALAIFQMITALLMVSPLFLPKLVMRKNKVLNVVQIAAIITGYICGFAMMFTEYIFALVALYAVGGFGYGLVVRQSVIEAKAAS